MKKRAIGALAALSVICAGTAQAADAPLEQSEVQATVAPSFWSNVMIRGRVVGVLPDSSAKLSVPGSAKVKKQFIPEFDATYFFTPNLAVETICCLTYHKVVGRGAIKGLDIGDTWLMPLTVMGQYHFTDFGRFKPYVGVGVNYSLYFSDDAKGGPVSRFKIHNSVGVVGQVGFDYFIDDHWALNFDLKRIHMRPKVDVTVGGAKVNGKATVDPWLAGVGIGYRF